MHRLPPQFDQNPIPAKLGSQPPRHRFERRFRDRIGQPEGVGDATGDRTDLNDRSATPPHQRHSFASAKECSGQIHLQRSLPIGKGDRFGQSSRPFNPSIINQEVYLSTALANASKCMTHVAFAADVAP